MNENHSQPELKYKTRWLASLLREASQAHPIIVLTGARQVGKSTLLQHELPFATWKLLTNDARENYRGAVGFIERGLMIGATS